MTEAPRPITSFDEASFPSYVLAQVKLQELPDIPLI
jgi:hypothetical protein